MLTKIFFGILIISLCVSCKTNLLIDESSKEIIPYKGTEKLQFVSNDNDTLNIYLVGIGSKIKDLNVEGQQYSYEQKLYHSNTIDGLVELTFVALSASPEGDIFVLNIFNKGHYVFEKEILISKLTDAGTKNYVNKNIVYKDVFSIPRTTDLKQEYYIRECYWSKSKGLIAFKENSGRT